MKPKLLFAVAENYYAKIFSEKDINRIKTLCQIIDAEIPKSPNEDFILNHIQDADIVITSWETARFDREIIRKASRLKLLCHAAGTVKPIVSDALWQRDVRVTSAAAAIAYGVAEFCLGLILMTPKRVFWAAQATRKGLWREGIEAFGGPFEIYQQKIGIIGASFVGRYLIQLLKNYTCQILLYDPYCSKGEAETLGAVKVESLDELFSQCRVVSLNAPETDATKKMIKGRHFRLLQNGSVFINTAKGTIVDEQEMIAELQKKRFVACLDVTDPEPPAADNPLRSLPNVILTPHEAGVVAENMLRLGTFVANEINAVVNGLPLYFEVSQEQLKHIG